MGVVGTEEDHKQPADLKAFVEFYKTDEKLSGDLFFGSPPPFQPASYTFTIYSINIRNTRSRGNDSLKGQVSGAVGAEPPQSNAMDLGDHGTGNVNVDLHVGPLLVSDPNIGVVFNYILANTGQDTATFNAGVIKTGQALAAAGAAAATAAIGAAIGATLGSGVMPVIGTILGAAAGWVVSQLGGLFFANCDGPVAVEQPAFKGLDLWNVTNHTDLFGQPHPFYSQTTSHPGLDSPAGCGSNSVYDVTWQIQRS